MSDIDDWENFEEDTNVETEKVEGKNKIEESEVIIKPKVEPKAPKPENVEKQDDYEEKWKKKNQDVLELKKLEEKAYEGLDEKTRAKKMEEKRVLDEVYDFMGADNKKFKGGERVIKYTPKNVQIDINLNTEKDFVDLAVLNIGKIKDSHKPSKFTFTYLKNSLDLLAPGLEADKIDQLIKDLTVMFNKKRKEESEKYGKKPKNKQPTINSGKAMETMAAKGKLDVYEDDHVSDNYENDDFM
jgi:hypothetical protein